MQLLARAAEGSMRDALSLTDQAIAMGLGQVTAETVGQMLGTLDDEQPLAIIEALVDADGEKVMALVEQAASRGVDWENLLIETLTLLHRIAMLQLLPNALDSHYISVEQRLRELARTLPPSDLQLFYQVLLTGRKELTYAPDRRMGVEMTLLRALAFHPKAVIAEPVAAPQTALPTMPAQGGAHSASGYMPAQNTASQQNAMPPAGQFQPQNVAPAQPAANRPGFRMPPPSYYRLEVSYDRKRVGELTQKE